MKKDFAYAVELPYWQAPNDDLLLKSQGDSLTAFLRYGFLLLNILSLQVYSIFLVFGQCGMRGIKN